MHGTMRVALCQIDPTVGAFDANRARIVAAAREAGDRGAAVVFFPELALCGYPPRDLLDRPAFIDAGITTLARLAAELSPELAVLVGFVDREQRGTRTLLFNAVALVRGGAVEQVFHKRLLPTYDVFDEDRYFEPGARPTSFEVAGTRFGVTICEDAWNDVDGPLRAHYDADPVADCVAAGAEVLVNLAASPFTLKKRGLRPAMFADIAKKHARPVVCVNQVGGNDDLVFDGTSAVFGPDGSLWARAPSFAEEILVVDLAPRQTIRDVPATDEAAALGALVLGTRDYALKCGFRSVVVGLSGGIDSALVACIAARALGPERVLGVAMPTRYSSEGSRRDALALAEALGIRHHVVDVDPIFQRHLDALGPALDALGPAGASDVTWENVQARIRGITLMALSNRFGHLLLTTGNKSEIAVGYCTLYGDMAGGLAVISDLPKTFVYKVAAEVNRQAGCFLIPESTIHKPPSAELRPNQLDADSLPPYEQLDAVLERFVEAQESPDAIVAAGFERALVERVARMVRRNEYKRRQMPPGLIVTRKAFGPGRRIPIAQGFEG
jgi:NAD+ synthetase